MKLLVIEDNAAMQTTLQRSFERRGFRVSICDDGAKALNRWRASVPDVVLLDLSLPGTDGLDVLAQARAEGLTAPVIIITARGTLGDRILGQNTGADDYQPKPFDLDELEARIRALARRQGLASDGLNGVEAPSFCGLRADAQPDAIEVVAYRLRKKLAATGAKLVTLRGLGYLLQAED